MWWCISFRENDYLIVINAGTREKDVQWVRKQIGHMSGVHVNDFSDYYTQLAIQGPKAEATLQKLTDTDLSGIKNYWFTWGKVCGLYNVMIARTGYTGEDGFEIYIPSDEATSHRVWGEVLEAGAEFGIVPCGLGSRNTLRLEAAMALYGHEISDSINVFEAGLGRYAKLDKPSFVGREALAEIQAAGGPKRKLVGLEMVGRGIGRDGYPVLSADGGEDWGDYEWVAGAIFEEEYCDGLCAGGVCGGGWGVGGGDSRSGGEGEGGVFTVLQKAEEDGLNAILGMTRKATTRI